MIYFIFALAFLFTAAWAGGVDEPVRVLDLLFACGFLLIALALQRLWDHLGDAK